VKVMKQQSGNLAEFVPNPMSRDPSESHQCADPQWNFHRTILVLCGSPIESCCISDRADPLLLEAIPHETHFCNRLLQMLDSTRMLLPPTRIGSVPELRDPRNK